MPSIFKLVGGFVGLVAVAVFAAQWATTPSADDYRQADEVTQATATPNGPCCCGEVCPCSVCDCDGVSCTDCECAGCSCEACECDGACGGASDCCTNGECCKDGACCTASACCKGGDCAADGACCGGEQADLNVGDLELPQKLTAPPAATDDAI